MKKKYIGSFNGSYEEYIKRKDQDKIILCLIISFYLEQGLIMTLEKKPSVIIDIKKEGKISNKCISFSSEGIKERIDAVRKFGRKHSISKKRLVKRIAVTSYGTMENIDDFYSEHLLNAKWKAIPIGELKEKDNK